MNNDINIVIKSQSQPDGGEGYSAGQAVHGNVYGEEGLSANMRGDEQKSSEALSTRDESASQDEVLYSSYEKGRITGRSRMEGQCPPRRAVKRHASDLLRRKAQPTLIGSQQRAY